MKVIDAIARILRTEGAEFLSAYPTTPLIEAAAKADIRPVICRQERVGVHMADGCARVMNGKTLGVFAMQYGPGAENAFPGIASAYSDSTPVLLLPLGHPRDRRRCSRCSTRHAPMRPSRSPWSRLPPATRWRRMRRAFSLMRMGRPGPVMVEVPADVITEEVPAPDRGVPSGEGDLGRRTRATSTTPPGCCRRARPMIHRRSGRALCRGDAMSSSRSPSCSTGAGDDHDRRQERLPRGSCARARLRRHRVYRHTVHHFREADVVFAIGCSFTRHNIGRRSSRPARRIIHATNDARDLNKN